MSARDMAGIRALLRDLTAAVDALEAELRTPQPAPLTVVKDTANKLLSIEQAADALNMSRTTVYRLFASGELSWVQIGAHRRITAAEIDRFVRAHTEVAS